MNLEIQSMWSPDLSPPSSGVPQDISQFDVFVQILIGEVGVAGGEVFDCRVCSVSALASVESGQFISHTLVLEKFVWSDVESRILKQRHPPNCPEESIDFRAIYPQFNMSFHRFDFF